MSEASHLRYGYPFLSQPFWSTQSQSNHKASHLRYGHPFISQGFWSTQSQSNHKVSHLRYGHPFISQGIWSIQSHPLRFKSRGVKWSIISHSLKSRGVKRSKQSYPLKSWGVTWSIQSLAMKSRGVRGLVREWKRRGALTPSWEETIKSGYVPVGSDRGEGGGRLETLCMM